MKRYLSSVLLVLVGSMNVMAYFDINIIDGEKKCMKPTVGDLVLVFNREGAVSMTMD